MAVMLERNKAVAEASLLCYKFKSESLRCEGDSDFVFPSDGLRVMSDNH